MHVIRIILEKIAAGFLYGIGLVAVVAIFSWVSSTHFKTRGHEDSHSAANGSACSDFKQCEEKSGLALHITSERIDKDDFVLLGKIANGGDIRWTSVQVKAELFDKDNNFIDQCTEYVDQKVFPGTAINFKLSCTKCSKVNLEHYDHYKASIIDANTY